MDLVPTPGQVVSAASNVAQKVAYGGLADLRPMPRTLIDEGTLREVYHYRPSQPVETGDPVLLVTPLAAPALCFDLRRGCSVVEHLVGAGRPTYVVEYGRVGFRDRALGMEHWIDDAVPTAIREVSAHAGGRPVHVVGWSLGGIFALLTAADQPDLPIASITLLGAPFDTTKVPIIAPVRPLLGIGGPQSRGLVTRAYQAMGGAPQPLVRWAFQLSSFQKLVTRPIAIATHLDDRDFLAQVEAVDRFTSRMTAYPGRTFGQLYHRFIKGNALVGGSFELGERTISLASVTAPVLVFGGANDTIAPIESVRSVLPLLSGSREVRFEVVPGGHLGMLTGRAARGSTWQVLDEWVAEWSAQAPPTTKPAPRKRTGKAAGKAAEKAPPAAVGRKAAGPKTPAQRAAAKRTAAVSEAAAEQPSVGRDPRLRHGPDASEPPGT